MGQVIIASQRMQIILHVFAEIMPDIRIQPCKKIDSMKIFIKIQTALIALLVMGFVNCHAQTSDKVESIMNEIVKKHDGKDGVTCLTVEKGSGF